jgi:hypothetical protein
MLWLARLDQRQNEFRQPGLHIPLAPRSLIETGWISVNSFAASPRVLSEVITIIGSFCATTVKKKLLPRRALCHYCTVNNFFEFYCSCSIPNLFSQDTIAMTACLVTGTLRCWGNNLLPLSQSQFRVLAHFQNCASLSLTLSERLAIDATPRCYGVQYSLQKSAGPPTPVAPTDHSRSIARSVSETI